MGCGGGSGGSQARVDRVLSIIIRLMMVAAVASIVVSISPGLQSASVYLNWVNFPFVDFERPQVGVVFFF